MVTDRANEVEFVGSHQQEVRNRLREEYVQDHMELADEFDLAHDVDGAMGDFQRNVSMRSLDHLGNILFESEHKVQDLYISSTTHTHIHTFAHITHTHTSIPQPFTLVA
jgi:hypothetical protein